MSGRKIADLQIKIGADSYEFQQKVQKVQNDLKKFSASLDKIGKDLSMKLTAPIMALGAASVYLADVQLRAEAKVQQALKSTRGVSQLNFDQLTKFASELQGKTIFGDEEILDKSTAQLLTFTNIAGENFKRAQTVALDLATVLNGDLQGASIQLGKALNDPVKSLSALRKSGIQFTNEQEAVIKKLASTGQMAKAQSLMLDELERQYGGQAEAAAKVGAGSLKQLKNSWGDFMEQIGVAILPTLNKLVDMLKGVVDWLQQLSPEVKNVIVTVGGLLAMLGPLALGISVVTKAIAAMKVGALAMLNPIMLAIEAIGLLILAVYKWNNLTADTMESWENQQLSLKNWTVDEAVKAYENSNKELSRLKAEREKLTKELNAYGKNIGGRNKNYERAQELKPQIEELKELIKTQENVVASRLKLIDTVKNQTSAPKGIIQDLESQIEVLQKKKLLPETSEADIKTINQEIAVLEQKLSKLNGTQITVPGVGQATGMIARLTEQVAQFEKAKAAATSTGQIAAFNEKIAETKTKIESLNAVTAQYLATRQQANVTPGVAVGMQIADAKIAPKIQVNPILQFIKSSNEIAGKIGEYINGITKDGAIPMQAAKMGLFIKKQIELNVSKGFKLNVATDLAISSANNIIGVVNEMNSILSSNVANAVSGIAKSIGSMMVGDMGFDGLLQGIAGQVGNFFIQLGELAIKVGTTMEAFKEAMTALVENPFVMIAIGVGMVILGQVLSSILNKKAEGSVPKLANGGLAFGTTYAMVGDNYNARVDPEVIAPLSKLKSMMLPSQSSGGFPDKLKFVIEGDKLVGVLSKYQKKLKYT